MYTSGMAIGRTGTRTGTRTIQKPRSPLGDRIVKARLRAGLTQKDLAEQLSVSQRAIAHWETNSVALRADQLAALADVLGVTVDYLMGREEGKSQKSMAAGKARQVFEEVNSLPRAQQQRILDVVQAMLAHGGAGHNARGNG
jgi:transcriptional regulator with XRE-family HTH domain